MEDKKETRLFWLKLNEHYFDQDHMVYLQTVENGQKYSLIWIRILLLCLKDTEENIGFLRFNSLIPYDDKLLAKVLREDIDTIRAAMAMFKKLEMIEILDNGTLYIEEIQRITGSEASSAERVRKHRKRKELLQCNADLLQCNDVTPLPPLHVTTVCNKTNVTLSRNKEQSRAREKSEGETDPNSLTHQGRYNRETTNIDNMIAYWNTKPLPEFRLLAINIPTCSQIIDACSHYRDEEIMSAIDNYADMLENAADYEYLPRYPTVASFLEKGIHSFFDGADPKSTFAKAGKPVDKVSDEDAEFLGEMFK